MIAVGVQQVPCHFDNSYARLPESFYARCEPTPVRSPRTVIFNHSLATSLGLDPETFGNENRSDIFGGNVMPEGVTPIAQAYAGHQFGHFTILGDGRAILLGEHLTAEGERFDIQLKGSGPTPFSRRGDGRAALGPMLREYIISEAMHALGIPSTRSLAVVTTGEPVYRSTTLPGAILTRIAASHIRVGTFEYFSAQEDTAGLRILADYTIRRHYPELLHVDKPYLALLQAVMERQAALVVKWLCVGFIHGVMNTDNMALSGETIDYGPCAFMDTYNPNTVFSSIDRNGRYAYDKQPQIAQWNFARFAETLLPLLHTDQEQAMRQAEEILTSFPDLFQSRWLASMRAKLGLVTEEPGDRVLIENFLQCLLTHQADFTNSFHALRLTELPDETLFHEPSFQNWHSLWRKRVERQGDHKASLSLMCSHNPAVIPRNHRVEEALAAAVEHSDFSVMQNLLKALKNPYENSPSQLSDYRAAPAPSHQAYQTFCGT